MTLIRRMDIQDLFNKKFSKKNSMSERKQGVDKETIQK